jgi:hypothetical protein
MLFFVFFTSNIHRTEVFYKKGLILINEKDVLEIFNSRGTSSGLASFDLVCTP